MSASPSTTPGVDNAHPWVLDRGRASGEMGYLPGLDGVRALAIIGVLLYHLGLDPFPGGFLGVDVFFVLSGFLITSLILEEFQRSGSINFKKFYAGRARRLLPALFLMLLIVGIAVALVYRDSAPSFRADALASIFYVNNWWYVIADHSYFEFTGRPALLNHLWSLAVEEQFYLIWPVIAFLVIKKSSRKVLGLIAFSGALLSTAWMVVIATNANMPEFADPSRAYFGTDSHAMGLLIGATLATFWRPGRLSTSIAKRARILLTVIGIVALTTLIGFYLFSSEFSPFLYRGGFLVFAILIAIVIALVTHPALALGTWLGVGPMRYLGRRSYGIYLWHWPVFMVLRPEQDIPLDGLSLLTLRLAITIGIAELSYRYVEMPIRRGALGRSWHKIRSSTPRAKERILAILGAFAAACVAIATAFALALVPSSAAIAPDVQAAIGSESEVLIDGQALAPLPTPAVESSASPSSSLAAAVDAPVKSDAPLSALGDSVLLGARGAVQDAIPGATIDASVSRYPGAFIGRVKKLSRAGALSDTVLVHMGTNGVMPERMLRDLLDQMTDYNKVILMNSSMPRSWEKPNNKVINKVAPDYPNVVIADWKAVSADHPEYFVSDKVHLSTKGAKAYAELVKSSMKP